MAPLIVIIDDVCIFVEGWLCLLHGIKQTPSIAVMRIVIPDDHVGDGPLMSHHVGVGDDAYFREVFGILDCQMA